MEEAGGDYTPPLSHPALGSNLGPAPNCHPGVSQARRSVNVCAVPQMDVKLGVSSASIPWWMLKIPWCASQRVDELSLAPWPNY